MVKAMAKAKTLLDDHADKAQLEDDVRLPGDVNRLVSAQRSARSKQDAQEPRLGATTIQTDR